VRAPRLSIGLGSFLVAVALVVAVGVGSAIAIIPNQGTYYACLTKGTGAVTVINYPKVKCAAGTRLIKWNAKGPAGPQGVQGPQGAQGPQGPKGDQGPAGPADWNAIPNKPAGFADGVDNDGVTGVKLTRVVGTTVNVPAGQVGQATATCPVGARVTGGGFFLSVYSGFSLGSDYPADSITWSVDGRNTSGADLSMTVYANCLSTVPAGALTIAKKGLLPASVKKAIKRRR
jgi:hypothetical protein